MHKAHHCVLSMVHRMGIHHMQRGEQGLMQVRCERRTGYARFGSLTTLPYRGRGTATSPRPTRCSTKSLSAIRGASSVISRKILS